MAETGTQGYSKAPSGKPLPPSEITLRQDRKDMREEGYSGSSAKALRQENARDGKAVLSTRKAAAGKR